ncbi:MAG: caspase family protein, partial [bacterium]
IRQRPARPPPFPITTSAQTETPRLVIDSGGHMALIRDIMFSPDGSLLYSASDDKTVRVWDVPSGEIVRVLRGQIGAGNEGKLFAAALSPDGRTLAVGGWLGPTDGAPGYSSEKVGRIKLLDAQSGEIQAVLMGHTGSIPGLAFSPDGKMLLSGSGYSHKRPDGTARLWDVASGRTRAVLKEHRNSVYALAFSPDGRRAVTGSRDRTLRLWRVPGGELIAVLRGHRSWVRAAAFTPDGRWLLSGSLDKTIRLWDGRTGEFIRVLNRQDSTVVHLSISPDGMGVVTGSGSAPAKNNIFRIPSGERVRTFTRHGNVVLATAFSPDGRLAATGGGNNQEIYLWDAATGAVRHKLVGRGRPVWSVGFSRDGSAIAWGKTFRMPGNFLFNGRGPLQQSFRLREDSGRLDPMLGEAVRRQDGWKHGIQQAGGVRLETPNSRIHKTLRILRGGRGAHRITRNRTNGFDHRSLTLTPDGRIAFSGGSFGWISSYDTATGRKLRDFMGHTGDVWSLAPSPDGRYLVSGSADQTVRLWEISSGKLLLTIFHATDGEWVAWTPQGYYTASLKGDRYIGWHINRGIDKSALYYPAATFAKRFRKPRVVAHYITTGGDLDAAIQLANAEAPRSQRVKKTAAADLGRMLPPAVFFQQPIGVRVESPQATLRVVAGARSITGDPITDIWLLVNGRRLGGTRGIAVKARQSTPPAGQAGPPVKRLDGVRASIEATVTLQPGENRIAVIAKNANTRSQPEMVIITRTASGGGSGNGGAGGGGGAIPPGSQVESTDAFKPNLYLLAVGVSKYQKSGYDLDVAHADAEAIAATFRRQQGGLYNKVVVRLLTNENATQDAVLGGLDWLEKQATQRDVAVVFMAGHGLKDNRGNYYFLPHDGDANRLRRTGVNWRDLNDVISNLPSKVLLFTDTCKAGAVTGKRRAVGSLVNITEALRELNAADNGVVIMAASTGNELSQERPEWGHGAFTKALLEGFDGKADVNRDGVIDMKEIDLYVTNRVKELTGGEQHPTTEIPRIMPNFPLVVN